MRASQKQPRGPRATLEHLVHEALNIATRARKHGVNLEGANYYADKLVVLRADATNVFRDLSANSAGNVSAMAEMIDLAFGGKTTSSDRRKVAKELIFALRTTWRDEDKRTVGPDSSYFPLSIVEATKRGYLSAIGTQMNGTYASGWNDAAAVMMRRLLEVAIIEAFENNGIAHKIRNAQGNYGDLSELISRALAENSWNLSRNTRKYLPGLRDVGHMSAHGRYYTARKDDLDAIRLPCRVVIEEFLYHAKLL